MTLTDRKPRRQHHECPDDPDAFFAQLLAVLKYRPDVPDGYDECCICGGLVPVDPEPDPG